VETTVAIEVDAAAAGESVHGRVHGFDGPATVALLRLEASPAGVHEFLIESSHVTVSDGVAPFELPAPTWLPPEATGQGCGLHYALRVTWRQSRWSKKEVIHQVAIRPADRAVHESRNRMDRIIPSQPGRGFHLELADAVLEGGGHISGRVHRDTGADDRSFLVTAECGEFWCTNFRFRTRRSPLIWKTIRLWSMSEALSIEGDDHWAPFRFEIPAGLPPATEARAIAWRYTIGARAEGRRAFTGDAVLTPVRFEV